MATPGRLEAIQSKDLNGVLEAVSLSAAADKVFAEGVASWFLEKLGQLASLPAECNALPDNPLDLFSIAELANWRIVPSTGSTLFFDSMAIPADAPHPNNAHLFINYILRPEVHASLTNKVFYANPNKASLKYVSKDVAANKSIFLGAQENTSVEADDAHPELREKAQQAMTMWTDRIAITLQKGIEKGEVRPDVDKSAFAIRFIGTLEGGIMLARLYKDVHYFDVMSRQLIEMVDAIKEK